MEFKNKKNKGWILEEIEKKKDECLDANQFGGENPEDVEKHQEEVNKEINKRFEGTKKNAEKVVGQDFEEHAKPHKVEEHYVGRKDLGEAISKLKEQNITYTVKRSPKEGFRYVVEYYSDEHKKEETLVEKIDLEEDDANEGMISGEKELSYDDLANLEKELWAKLDERKIHPEDGTFSNSSNRLADIDLTLVIRGDWKHDHMAAEDVVEKFLEEKGYVVAKHTEETIEENGSDDYTSEHKWYLIKDTDGKMTDTVNTLHQMFTPKEEESLEEAVETKMYVIYSDKDEGPTMDEIKGALDEIGSKIEDVKEQGKDCYLVHFKASKDNLFKALDKLNIPHEDESEFIVNEVLDDEELPDAIPDEAIVVSTEPGDDVATVVKEPSEEVKKAGLYNALSAELRDTLQDIENLKSLTVTFVEEGREDLIDDLNAIIDERTIHSGMLQDLMSRVEGKVEAEETNNEEPKPDNNDAEIIEVESLKEGLTKDQEEEIKRWAETKEINPEDIKKRINDRVNVSGYKLKDAFEETMLEVREDRFKDWLDYTNQLEKELKSKLKEGLLAVELINKDTKEKQFQQFADEKELDKFLEKHPELKVGRKMERESLNENADDDFKNLTIEDMFLKVANKEFKVFDKDGHFTKQAQALYNKVADRYGDYDKFDALCREEGCFEESLKEAKEETIHLDKYEIDDEDTEEQKEDAKIMPYGEVTKSQWEDFLSKAKWPYWLAWENLKNEVEHKD